MMGTDFDLARSNDRRHMRRSSAGVSVRACVCLGGVSPTFSWYWRRDESNDCMRAVAWPMNMA